MLELHRRDVYESARGEFMRARKSLREISVTLEAKHFVRWRFEAVDADDGVVRHRYGQALKNILDRTVDDLVSLGLAADCYYSFRADSAQRISGKHAFQTIDRSFVYRVHDLRPTLTGFADSLERDLIFPIEFADTLIKPIGKLIHAEPPFDSFIVAYYETVRAAYHPSGKRSRAQR